MADVPVPPAVVTAMRPVAVVGTAAKIDVFDNTVNRAATPLKVTPVAPAKFVPVMVTPKPRPPEVAVNDVTVGTVAVAVTVKLVADVAVPAGVTTVIRPVTAPVGTPTTIDVADTTLNAVVATPPNVTDVAPVKFVPVIVTPSPRPPVAAVKDVMVGAGFVTVNEAPVAVPPGVVTDTAPVTPPVGTTNVIRVADATVNDCTALVPIFTIDAPVKFEPVIVTVAPAATDVGVNDEIVGAGVEIADPDTDEEALV